MNNINSIILEGKVEKIDAFLTIGVSRVFKNENGEDETQTSFFDVVLQGHRPPLRVGDFVRVVGRLIKDGSAVLVLSEHTEYRRCE